MELIVRIQVMEVEVPSTELSQTTSSKSPNIKATSHVPFIEKYRPKVLSDVIGNEDTVARLSVIAREGNMPNIILSGPPVNLNKTYIPYCI